MGGGAAQHHVGDDDAIGSELQALAVESLLQNRALQWTSGIVTAAGLALLVWAAMTFGRAGTDIPVNRPTSTIVEAGPYRFTRNPIYTGMFLGLIGFSIAFDSLWLLILLVPFYLVIRYGVVAREEAYLERKFGDVYRAYKTRVRRWL